MTNIFLIGCTHYNHGNIIKFCNRPFNNVIEMNNALYSRHKRTVTEYDTYINLGDFSFGNARDWKDIMSQLNFKEAWLIQGNHDKEKQQDILNSGFSKIFRK